ncbi:MAG: HAD family hydrolase [Lachnospiraceae bacterium]|nr:HAD family hydrolase [Lachnospiraceae bacterium]
MKTQLPLTYENYIFDLYGTLVDIHTDESLPALWEKMSFFYGYYGARYTPDELRMTWNRLTEHYRQEAAENTGRAAQGYEANPAAAQCVALSSSRLRPAADAQRGGVSTEIEIDLTCVIQALYSRKGVTASRELAVHTGQFFRVLSTEYIRLYDGTVPMLERLRANGKKVWLLSNAQRIFTQYELCLLDLERHFDGILISSDYGAGKPNPFFFQQLIEQFGIDFSRSLFIGNDAVNDIGGAQGVGLDSFYVHSNLSFVEPSWVEAAPLQSCKKQRKASAVCKTTARKEASPMQFRLGGTTNYTVLNFTAWA